MEKSKQLKALEYAFSVIEESDLFPDKIEKIILFGSYANGTNRRDSDIDLLVVVKNGIIEKEYSKIRLLKADMSQPEAGAVPADVKFVSEEEFNLSDMTFYKLIRENGIEVWKNEQKTFVL
jgi:predicted nucleotidyltransferase